LYEKIGFLRGGGGDQGVQKKDGANHWGLKREIRICLSRRKGGRQRKIVDDVTVGGRECNDNTARQEREIMSMG